MHISFAIPFLGVVLATAASANTCDPSKHTVHNGGFEASPSLAPWRVSGGPGYVARRMKRVSSATDRYVAKLSPGPPLNPREASSNINVDQSFTVCANYTYNITYDWTAERKQNSGLYLIAAADPDDLCPDNCIFTTLVQEKTSMPNAFSSSGIVHVPAVANSTTSVIFLRFEPETSAPYNKTQVFTLNNVKVTPL